LTFRAVHTGRSGRCALILATVASMVMVLGGAAGAAPAPRRASTSRCRSGYRVALKVVRKSGKSKVFHVCKKAARPKKSTIPMASVTDPTPAAGGTGALPAVTTTPPAVPSTTPGATPAPSEVPPPASEGSETTEEPGTPKEEVPNGATQVQAAIGLGYKQNPLVPNEVTWRYSATATQTVTTDGVTETKSVPLPEGELAFFVDGKLDCEITALGAIAGSACTVPLQALGEHEVETIYSATGGGPSSTVTRTDFVNKYPTQTNLQVSVEPVAPEYLEIGPNAYGFIQYGFEVGRLRVTATTTPGGYPTFDCEGQPAGCLEPELPSLASHHGSVSVPLFSQNRLNMATGKEEWKVAFHAYNPTLREYGDFWQYPEESVGAQFFHVESDPEPRLYEPSSVTVPLNLNGGHYPLYHWFRDGEAGGSVAAVEGTARKVMDLGTYVKVDGPEEWLKILGEFHGTPGETEGCVYRLRIDGKDMNEDRQSSTQNWEFDNGWSGFAAGPHTFEMWVERAAGAGPGKCATTSGTFEAYEVAR
jgi:hypothetical protein